MNELYWIGRCAAVNEIAGAVIAVVLLFVLTIIGVVIFVGFLADVSQDENLSTAWKWIKRLAVIGSVATLFYVFVPSQKEMYLILGIGGTIDYLQSNEKAGQIPDKCLDAIDAWVDALVEDEKSKE